MTKLFTLCAITLVSIAAATTTLSSSAETNMPFPARAHLQLDPGPVSLRGGRASSTLDDAERHLFLPDIRTLAERRLGGVGCGMAWGVHTLSSFLLCVAPRKSLPDLQALAGIWGAHTFGKSYAGEK